MRVMEVNRHTSMSNGIELRRSSGSIRSGSRGVAGSTEKRSAEFENWSSNIKRDYWSDGMSSSTTEASMVLATGVDVTDDTLTVELADGRTVAAPLAWYPRLVHATPAERKSWRLIADGRGIHWQDLDEDISVENILAGQPSGESQKSFKKWLEARGEPRRARKRSRG
jgi:hypothetical protein